MLELLHRLSELFGRPESRLRRRETCAESSRRPHFEAISTRRSRILQLSGIR